MTGRVIERLAFLGFEIADDDLSALKALVNSCVRRIVAETGWVTLPEPLEDVAVNWAAGEFLFYKKAAGRLEGFDAGAAVKQLQEGDTSVTYAFGDGSSTPEERLDALIGLLTRVPEGLLAAWRRLRW